MRHQRKARQVTIIAWHAVLHNFIVKTRPLKKDAAKRFGLDFRFKANAKFDPLRKIWTIKEDKLKIAEEICHNYFGPDVRVMPKIELRLPPSEQKDFYGIFCSIIGYDGPKLLVEEAHRKWRFAMSRLHPDLANGNATQAAALNEAWREVKIALAEERRE